MNLKIIILGLIIVLFFSFGCIDILTPIDKEILNIKDNNNCELCYNNYNKGENEMYFPNMDCPQCLKYCEEEK